MAEGSAKGAIILLIVAGAIGYGIGSSSSGGDTGSGSECHEYLKAYQAYAGTLSRYHDSAFTAGEDMRTGWDPIESWNSHLQRVSGDLATEDVIDRLANDVYGKRWDCSWAHDRAGMPPG